MTHITGLSSESVDQLLNAAMKVMRTTLQHTFASVAEHVVFTSKTLVAAAPTGSFDSVSPDALGIIQVEWAQQINDTFVPFIAKVHQQAAVAASVGMKDAFPALEEVTIPLISDDATLLYLTNAKNRIGNFSNEMWEIARNELMDGIAEGESIDKLAKRIQGVTDISEKRANVIARTETISALNGGEFSQMVKMAEWAEFVATKTWEATDDTHTRESHRLADGQTVALNEKFNVGIAFLDFPGDPLGTPSEVISCRCTTLYDVSETSLDALSAAAAIVDNGDSGSFDDDFKFIKAIVATGKKWNASDHPRGNDGRFIKTGFLPGKILSTLKSGFHLDDLNESELQEFIGDINKLEPKHWDVLTPEQKQSLAAATDEGMELGIPGSATAMAHLEDLDDDELITVDEDTPDVFTPPAPTPASSQPISGLNKDILAVIGGQDWDQDQLVNGVKELTQEQWDKLSEYSKNQISEELDALIPGQLEIPMPISELMDVKIYLANLKSNEAVSSSQAHKFPDLPTTTQLSPPKPIKITHGLIHAKHANDTIAQTTLDDGTKVQLRWNGSKYEIFEKSDSDAGWKWKNSFIKSKTYAGLAQNYPDANWTEPGKLENTAPPAVIPSQAKIPNEKLDVNISTSTSNDSWDATAESIWANFPKYPVGTIFAEATASDEYDSFSYRIRSGLNDNGQLKLYVDEKEKDNWENKYGEVKTFDSVFGLKSWFTSSTLEGKWKKPESQSQPDSNVTPSTDGGASSALWTLDGSDILTKSKNLPITTILAETTSTKKEGIKYRLIIKTDEDGAIGVVPQSYDTHTKDWDDLSLAIEDPKSIQSWLDAKYLKENWKIPTLQSEWVESALNKLKADDSWDSDFKNSIFYSGEDTPENVDVAPNTPKATNDISHLSAMEKHAFYGKFKNQNISPSWSGKAIYEKLLKTQESSSTNPDIASLNLAQMLAIVDFVLWDYGKAKKDATPYTDKVMAWANTSAGKKVLGDNAAQLKMPVKTTGSTANAPSALPKIQKAVPTTQPTIATVTTAPTTSTVPIPIPGAQEETDAVLAGNVTVPNTISDGSKKALFDTFKGYPSGKFLNDDPSLIWKSLDQLQKQIKAKITDPEINKLNKAQLLKIIDEQGAKNLKVENKFLFEKKIQEWLKNPVNLQEATHTMPFDVDKILKHNAPSAATVIPLASQPDRTKAEVLAMNSSEFKTMSIASAKSWYDTITMTVSQRNALKKYTGSYYYEVNSALRLHDEPDASIIKNAKLMQDGMRPIDHDILVHRGTGYNQFGGAKNASDLEKLIGKTVQDKAFMSTSVGGKAAFGGQVQLEIEVPRGTGVAYAKPFSHYSGENEMILSAGLRFRVLSVTQVGYQSVVRVRVVPPPDGTV